MRKCGKCTVCCYLGAVPEIHKPQRRTCKYQGDGCNTYHSKNRPKVCCDFNCAWMHGIGHDNDRPDKSNIMISASSFNGGDWTFAIETSKNALENEGKRIILDAVAKREWPVIVVDYDPPHDFGNRVIIKKELEPLCNGFRGTIIEEFSKDINIYELVRS